MSYRKLSLAILSEMSYPAGPFTDLPKYWIKLNLATSSLPKSKLRARAGWIFHLGKFMNLVTLWSPDSKLSVVKGIWRKTTVGIILPLGAILKQVYISFKGALVNWFNMDQTF